MAEQGRRSPSSVGDHDGPVPPYYRRGHGALRFANSLAYRGAGSGTWPPAQVLGESVLCHPTRSLAWNALELHVFCGRVLRALLAVPR